jgi:carbamoyl-phosphate synthase large subunit
MATVRSILGRCYLFHSHLVDTMSLTIAVSGMHRGDNPQPGPAVAASILRMYPTASIVGLSYDMLESGMFAPTVHHHYLMPFPTKGPKALLKRIDEIIVERKIDMIIPCLDSELQNYIDISKDLKKRGILSPVITQRAFDMRSKENLAAFGKAAGVHVPHTVVVKTDKELEKAVEEIGLPLYVKGKQYGAMKVNSLNEALDAFDNLIASWGGPVICQAPTKGTDEYDVMGLGDGKGGYHSVAIRKIMVTPAGKAFGGVVIDNPILNKSVQKIIKKLRWNGPFELEFVGDELIEMNPRFPAWVDFPSQVGCNLPVKLIETMAQSSSIFLKPCHPGQMFMRHCVDYVGTIDQLAELVR